MSASKARTLDLYILNVGLGNAMMGGGWPQGAMTTRLNCGDWKDETDLPLRASGSGEGVGRVMRDQKTGRDNHHHRLWALMSLEMWFGAFVDRADISSGPI